MITEDYVSFEIAKLLKEKGFNEKCDNCYAYFADDDIRCLNLGYPKSAQSLIKDRYPYVTLQMAMKWLREVQNLFVFPFPQMNTNKFWTEIYQLSDNQEWENLYCESIDLQDYPTYEEACEAAIKYILENLI